MIVTTTSARAGVRPRRRFRLRDVPFDCPGPSRPAPVRSTVGVQFRDEFVTKATGQFGSGWAWLVQSGGQLKIYGTPNGVNPLCFDDHALLGCDVWEHSYYLDYRNRRGDYVKAFLDNMVDWEAVASRMAR